ncbi:MAG: Integral rane sensor signal transduction histidine kinase [Gammaproteobacteria bacterium]|nr:Integral rane sensor signal transduction histidine kinase [Gammaproteobacteria bacterium]
MNTRSLSFRLVTWYAGLLTIVFVLLGALTIIFLRHYLEANLLDIQARRAQQIADTLLTAASRTGDAVVAGEIEDLYSPEVNDRFIRITRADGHVVYASGKPKDAGFDPSRVPPPSLTRDKGFQRKESLPSGSLLIAARTYGDTRETRYIVEVGVSTARTEATLSQVLIMLAVGLPIAVCVAVAGGFILVRRALKPVDRLSHKAEEITQHNLSERLPVMRSGDELERLSLSLNLMISRLEDAIQSSKQFVADASHELRTPLAVLRGELESLAQEAQLKSQTRETLGSMLEEVDRLAEIVEGLLALSRLDTGEAQAEWVRFDLAELAATTADQISLLAEDKNITLVCEASTNVPVEGDRARLKQVVVNLLDNAIKYTPNGGRIRMKITREGDYALLDVSDDGIGIPPEALSHVFKRFYRVDGSRSREQGGAGLGLSIVKSICAAHGAQVEVASVPGKGSSFRIRQPLARESAALGPS